MKKIYTLLFLLLYSTLGAQAQAPARNFITKWTFAEAATTITFNALTAGGDVNYTWSTSPSNKSGNGTFTSTTEGSVTLSGLDIAANDVVTLEMEPANLRRFHIRDGADKDKLTDVAQWGTVSWTSMRFAFWGCSKLNITATDVPDLSQVTDMSSMFKAATTFNGDISKWNTGSVKDMSYMFQNASAFNGNLSMWNTASATDMSYMLSYAIAFKGDISGWETASVTNMSGMFYGAEVFNQDISNWTTTSVMNMGSMFYGAAAFDQNIGNWETGKVTSMNFMFYGAVVFNQNISNWKTENVISMRRMFANAAAFNQDIGGWKLNTDVNMTNMLDNSGIDCINYSKTLDGWYTNNPTVKSRTLGADGLFYGPSATKTRASLVSTSNRKWTIAGDALAGSPVLVAADEEKVGTNACAGPFSDPVGGNKKLLNIELNGNTLDLSQTTVMVTNKFVASPPSGVSKNESSGFYEANSGAKTIRISRRLHSIVAPEGTYDANDGVIVRVYYDPAELTAIKDNNTKPTGSDDLTKDGWFKSSKHSAAEVVNSLSANGLANAQLIEPITPMGTGIENGVSYAQFKMQSFSTIGYFASNLSGALPVTLVSFSGKKTGESQNTLTWVTSEEKNFDRFEVQKSADARSFENIGTVNSSSATASTIHTYQFADKSAVIAAYYRLKMVDIDGTFTYSRVIHVGNGVDETVEEPVVGSFYPNPSTAQATVDVYAPEGGNWTITMLDASGKTLRTETRVLQQGVNKVLLGELINGLNLVQFQNGQMSVTRKLVRE